MRLLFFSARFCSLTEKENLLSIAQSICASYVALSIVLLAYKPEFAPAAGVFCTVALFIGITWLEKNNKTDLDELSAKVTVLKNQVEMILINKGFGR